MMRAVLNITLMKSQKMKLTVSYHFELVFCRSLWIQERITIRLAIWEFIMKWLHPTSYNGGRFMHWTIFSRCILHYENSSTSWENLARRSLGFFNLIFFSSEVCIFQDELEKDQRTNQRKGLRTFILILSYYQYISPIFLKIDSRWNICLVTLKYKTAWYLVLKIIHDVSLPSFFNFCKLLD